MAQEAVSDSMQVVTFCLVNQTNNKREDYAIPFEQVKEIRTLEEITKVPKAKSFVRGIMNLRGLIIPVIDVKDKLGFGSTDLSNKSKSRMLKNPTMNLEELEKNTEQLLKEALENQESTIRRLGVKVSELSEVQGQSDITSYF